MIRKQASGAAQPLQKLSLQSPTSSSTTTISLLTKINISIPTIPPNSPSNENCKTNHDQIDSFGQSYGCGQNNNSKNGKGRCNRNSGSGQKKQTSRHRHGS